MALRSLARRLNAKVGERLGIRLVHTDALFPWQMGPAVRDATSGQALPDARSDSSRWDNPRLLELTTRYAAFDPEVTRPASWTADKISGADLARFRGDSAYLWQARGRNSNELACALSYFFLKTGAAGPLLNELGEDGAFGALTVELDRRLVSRDLLDSASEIQFLREHAGLGTTSRTIVDIGAGYGRLTHRIAQAHPVDVRAFATDAVAVSTFLCERYLAFRGLPNATSVPLDEIEALMASTPFDLALNVHSFSECTPEAVAWWTERLAHSKVKRLMVVPNGTAEQARHCRFNDGQDMEAIFMRFGYRRAALVPRYADAMVQRYGLEPTWYHLFELG